MADLPVTLTHPKTGEKWVCETPTAYHDALARGYIAGKAIKPAAAPTPADDSKSVAKTDTKTTTK